jgi:hypothetical protein
MGRHPNIVHVHDFGETGDTLYIVTDVLEGCAACTSCWRRSTRPRCAGARHDRDRAALRRAELLMGQPATKRADVFTIGRAVRVGRRPAGRVDRRTLVTSSRGIPCRSVGTAGAIGRRAMDAVVMFR